ncbi:MAG: glycosyltransferase family 2 protein [Bacteroidales bacterium]|nr:glycosyltransferase family 2 protein [Bacteroidales bacterium]
MRNISAVIITCNEARNIGRCLDSLAGVADEIIVVDSGSTDNTELICKEYNVRFDAHPWEGYDKQKNYANSLATNSWIFSIDADEALSPKLRESLMKFKQGEDDATTAYSVNRLTYYQGRAIRHCGWYPERKVRLFRKGEAKWDGIVHEDLVFEGKAANLDGDLLHYPYNGLNDLIAKYSKYASLMADKYHSQGKHATTMDCVLRPLWTFLRNYLIRFGMLDGHEGWTICKMMAYYTFMKYTLLREKRQ